MLRRAPFVFVLLTLLVSPAIAGWPTPERSVCLTTSQQRWVNVMPDGSDGVLVQWSVYNSGYELYAQHINGSGLDLWPTDGIYYDASSGSYGTILTSGVAAGAEGFAWAFISGGVVWASHVGPTGLPDWNIHPVYGFGQPVAVGTAQSYVNHVRVASDGTGGILVAWTGVGAGAPNPDVYVQRLDGMGTPLWTVDGVLVCAPAGTTMSATRPSIVSDGAGGAFVSWEDIVDFNLEDVFVQHIDANGALQWGPEGVRVTANASEHDWYSRVLSDRSGGAIVLFTATPNTGGFSSKVLQRFDSTGALVWTRSLLGGASVGAVDMTVTAGGTILGILEHSPDNTAAGLNLYSFSLDSAGVYAWGADTASGAYCTEPGKQEDPRVVQALDGTVWTTWKDGAAPGVFPKIFYRSFDPSLAPGAAAGDTLDSYPSAEHSLVALPDGSVVAAYIDRRNGNPDVFATIFSSTPTAVTGAASFRARLGANWPNPFSVNTSISYSLRAPGRVELTVYDLRGRRVRSLVQGQRTQGEHRLIWDGRDEVGQAVASGTYLLRLHYRDSVLDRRLTLLR